MPNRFNFYLDFRDVKTGFEMTGAGVLLLKKYSRTNYSNNEVISTYGRKLLIDFYILFGQFRTNQIKGNCVFGMTGKGVAFCYYYLEFSKNYG